MNMTLHLTTRCNLDCRYCFEHRSGFSPGDVASMSEETAIAAVNLVYRAGQKTNGFALFGGEPMLERALIERLVSYIRSLDEEFARTFEYKLTTNGLLLDEDFCQFAAESRMEISLSHDGLMHDAMRVYPDGRGSRRDLDDRLRLLLSYQPNTLAMCTVTPQTVQQMAESVAWLADQGFRRIVTTIDYRPDAGWDDDSMAQLRAQYDLIGRCYAERFGSDQSFRYFNFEEKIRHHIFGDAYCGNQCHWGKKQPSVATDGTIYPCVQFVGDREYAMGTVFDGIDPVRQQLLYEKSLIPIALCEGCELQPRCRNGCCCLNYQLTGRISTPSPVQCAHERILIPAADRVAAALFSGKTDAFVTHFYTTTKEPM